MNFESNLKVGGFGAKGANGKVVIILTAIQSLYHLISNELVEKVPRSSMKCSDTVLKKTELTTAVKS